MLNKQLLCKLSDLIEEEKNIDIIMDNIINNKLLNNDIIKKIDNIDTYVRKCVYTIKHYLLNEDVTLKTYYEFNEIVNSLKSIQDMYSVYIMKVMVQNTNNNNIDMKKIVDYLKDVDNNMRILKI